MTTICKKCQKYQFKKILKDKKISMKKYYEKYRKKNNETS
jgi:hypothetical protein